MNEVSGNEEIMKFLKKYKVEFTSSLCLIGFVIGITVYLTNAPLESIQYDGAYIIPWAYPTIGLCMTYFKIYVMSKRLTKIKERNGDDPHFLLSVGSNAFSTGVFLFADLVTLTAAMLSFYAIGSTHETDAFHRIHTIEPLISCGIIPAFAMISSCSLDTTNG